MIVEILDRRFVLTELGRVRDDLTGQLLGPRVRGGPPLVGHAADLADALGDALARETEAEEVAVAHAQENGDRKGRVDHSSIEVEEHFAYLPSDALISVTQSLIEDYVDRHPELVTSGRPPQQQVRGATIYAPPPVTERRLRTAAAAGEAPVRLFERFSVTDPRWMQSKLSEWFARWNEKHPFIDDAHPRITPIESDARIVLVGDWASGIERARAVADLMRQYVIESMGRGQDVHVVHLGDTYYSGWRKEYRTHLLPYWPIRAEEAGKAGSWTLNGNHDMYSGGDGFYELLQDPRFSGHNGLSFFHLQNDDWNILGLDTAYKDHDLAGSQSIWVERAADDVHRKTMLMSHHPPVSSRSDSGRALRRTLGRVLREDRPVDAWFWGHEHRHAHYEAATMGLRTGRVLGHGGVPAWMLRDARSGHQPPETWEYRDRLPGAHLQPWGLLGFAVLDLRGPAMDVRYVNERGSIYLEEAIR